LLPDVKVGEYVIVHVGFAISRMDEEEALETLNLLREAGEAMEEPGPPDTKARTPGENPAGAGENTPHSPS
jgi:hypothetical protein